MKLKLTTAFIAIYFFSLPFNVFSQDNFEAKITEVKNSIDSLDHERDELLTKLEEIKLGKIRYDLETKGLPKLEEDEELIMHSAMALVYNDKHKLAKWVAHIITYDIVEGNVVRSNDFREDPKISSGTAVEADYFLKEKKPDGSIEYDGFGYDRGHLAPSADFRWSETALSESYFYSNMTPQAPEFNRKSWASLENTFRSYVQRNEGSQLFIVTAPVIQDDLPKIERGVNKISIPEYHYKIAVHLEEEKGIAFLMPNELCDLPIENYSVTIDSIESLTGIDFFHNLPDDLQAKIESQNDPISWFNPSEQTDKLPIPMNLLPKNHFNTTQAKRLIKTRRDVSICGTVVSARKSGKGNIFLNLDKSFPDQVFTVTIFNVNRVNFSYEPHVILLDEKICVTGKVTDYNGTPSMVIDNEKSIEILRKD